MSDNIWGFQDQFFMLSGKNDNLDYFNLQQLSPLENYSETPCFVNVLHHPQTNLKMNHFENQTVNVPVNMDLLEKITFSNLADFERAELNTPPIKKEQDFSLQTSAYINNSFGGLDPSVENSVNLNDLIGSLDQEDYDSLLMLSGSPTPGKLDQQLKPFKDEELKATSVQSLLKSEVFAAHPLCKEELILPLTVIEEEVGSFESADPEEDYHLVDESVEQNEIKNFATLDTAALPQSFLFAKQQEDIDQSSKVAEKLTLKAIPASRGRPVSSRQRKELNLDKSSTEYRDRRDRNNASVRKSRDKAKQRQEETEGRLETLTADNKALQEKVDSLQRELEILRGLFTNIGASIPNDIKLLLAAGRK